MLGGWITGTLLLLLAWAVADAWIGSDDGDVAEQERSVARSTTP